MKRFILFMLVIALLFFITGCQKNNKVNDGIAPEPALSNESEEALSELQEKISADEKLLGVAYLGFIDYDTEFNMDEFKKRDHIKALPFIENIYEYAENEGYRIYCIVPADEQVEITVCKCEFDDEYMPYGGEELIKANGPILVRGNVSYTIPNLYVIAKKGSEKLCYTPGQSGMDGKLDSNKDKVYDFTPYDTMVEFSGADRLTDAVFCGNWTAFAKDGNGEKITLILTLEPDGKASYAYGVGNNEILGQFEGIWILDENDILKLELIGGSPENIGEAAITEPYECNPSFEWEYTAEGLSLTHTQGDEIISGTKGQTFDFVVNEY